MPAKFCTFWHNSLWRIKLRKNHRIIFDVVCYTIIRHAIYFQYQLRLAISALNPLSSEQKTEASKWPFLGNYRESARNPGIVQSTLSQWKNGICQFIDIVYAFVLAYFDCYSAQWHQRTVTFRTASSLVYGESFLVPIVPTRVIDPCRLLPKPSGGTLWCTQSN